MSLKLIACDVDGTLMHHEEGKHIICDENIEAIERALDNDIIVALATGRGYDSAQHIHNHLGLNTPMICMNGAHVIHDEKTHVSETLDSEFFQIFLDLSQEHDLSYYLMAEDEVFVVSENFQKFAEAMQTLGFDEDHYSGFKLLNSLKDLPEDYNDRVYKIVLQDFSMQNGDDSLNIPEARKTAMKYKATGKIPQDLGMVSSWNNNIEIMTSSADKGTGVATVAKLYGVDRSEIMCIGDNENDIAMLDYGKFSVAMGNASDYVKKHARFITDSVENCGVANIINRALDEKW